ncbi:MAG: hypothetical protein JNN33_11495 [Rhodospirillaceae bacterium]|nr:hypothetical protein [Rhodospirillaceae bacterium]
MQRLFASKRKQRTGLSFILFAFTFLCVIGAASFLTLIGVRSGMIKAVAPQVRDFAADIGLLDPATCVVDARNQLDCRAGAEGTSIRLVIGELQQTREDLARERELRIAAEEKAKTATEALRRLADSMQSVPGMAPSGVAAAAERAQPYVMLPGDVVQPFSKRLTLVYRQPVDATKVLLGSDLWQGDREMEFYKPYRATIGAAGEKTELELVVSPAPDWSDGDRSIRLELKPLETAAPSESGSSTQNP